MGLSIEQQREKIRSNNPTVSLAPPKRIKRLVNGKVVSISKKQNKKLNKKNHKPPIIIYGHNTK